VLTASKQRLAILTVCYSIISIKEHEIAMNTAGVIPEPIKKCKLILQGEGGTGKSHTLRYIIMLIKRHLGNESLKTFAPTAHAASLIGGDTIHSAFQIPISVLEFAPLGPSVVDRLVEDLNGVQALIGDEMGMISPILLYFISQRCIQGKNNPLMNLPVTDFFPGINIIVLSGDYNQLKPVRAPSLVNDFDVIDAEATPGRRKIIEYTNLGLYLYQSYFDKAIILDENFRSQQFPLYCDFLKRVRNGKCTQRDLDMINGRCISVGNHNEFEEPYIIIRLSLHVMR
jgi:hypothetical protein